MDDDKIKIMSPVTLGWLEAKLEQDEIDYLWNCIKNKKGSAKKTLAGNNHESSYIEDTDNWFFNRVLSPLCDIYSEVYRDMGQYALKFLSEDSLPSYKPPYCLSSFWVNYQKQNEFNPVHDHSGIYSFVIWMKIPTKHKEQNEHPRSKFSGSPIASSFNFHFVNILGENDGFIYQMNPEMEGTIVFFPAKLSHSVYPFYDCEEDRISISGNVSLNTKIILNEE